jgi:hypothetical protein
MDDMDPTLAVILGVPGAILASTALVKGVIHGVKSVRGRKQRKRLAATPPPPPVRLAWRDGADMPDNDFGGLDIEVVNHSGRRLRVDGIGVVFECDGNDREQSAHVWWPEHRAYPECSSRSRSATPSLMSLALGGSQQPKSQPRRAWLPSRSGLRSRSGQVPRGVRAPA